MEQTIRSASLSDPVGRPVESSPEEIEYSPAGVKRNGANGWILMAKEIADNRRLIWLLVRRDISVRYRQSILGYVWAVLPPLLTVATFAFLNASRVIPIGNTRIPYVAFALWGLSVWQLFAGCLSACTASLVASGALVTKVNFPRETLVIAALGQPVFDFCVRFVPVIAVFVWYGTMPHWGVVFVPLLLLIVTLLALGFGFVLSIANLVFRDTSNALGMVLTVGMFLTPVLYPAPVRWPFFLVNALNPLSPFVTATQDLIAIGYISRPEMLAAACLFSFTLAFGGWRAFHVTIPRVAGYA
jgi:lipopolysaccharide transport system permease protein